MFISNHNMVNARLTIGVCLYLHVGVEEEPESRHKGKQQACSVYRRTGSDLSLHVPEAPKTSGLLTWAGTYINLGSQSFKRKLQRIYLNLLDNKVNFDHLVICTEKIVKC